MPLHNIAVKAKGISKKKALVTPGFGWFGHQPVPLLQSILDALSMPVALLDEDGQIIATNNAWRKLRRHSGSKVMLGLPGASFRAVCKNTADRGFSERSCKELDLVLTGKRKSFDCTFPLDRDGVSDEICLRVTRFDLYPPRRSIVTLEPVPDLARARHSAGELGQRVLEIQAEERQRFATELHDSIGQYFISLELLLSRLRMGAAGPEPAAAIVREMSDVLREAQSEIRTLSFLLSPPWIEYERGLERAISAFVQGFAKRAEIKADIHVHGPPFRLDQSRQVALFRIVQEALVNIYRHANADLVAVNLVNQGANVILQVTDNGTGFSGERTGKFEYGAGLAGMHARINYLGGELHIDTGASGTTLTATLPSN